MKLIVVKTPHGVWIQGTSATGLDRIPPHVTNTSQLRECLLSDDGMERLVSLKHEWASCILQLLQMVCPHAVCRHISDHHIGAR